MNNLNFVDLGLRYGNDSAVKENSSSRLLLWKKDYKYIQVSLNLEKDSIVEFKLNYDKNKIRIDYFILKETLAFIGSAGYKAENPFSIMPRGPKEKVRDIVAPFEKGQVKQGLACFLFKVESLSQEGVDNIEIAALIDGKESNTIITNVEIINREFIDPKDYSFKVEYWHHPYNVSDYYKVEPFSKEHLNILKENQLLYKSLGGDGVICTVLDEVWGGQTYGTNKIKYPSMVKWNYSKEEGFTYDYTILDLWISSNIEWGLDNKFICYSMMPWGNLMRYYDKDKNKYINRRISTKNKIKYDKVWGEFLEDFVIHLDEKNWFDKIYIGFDERSDMKHVLDLVEKFKNKEGKSFKISASFNNYLRNRECLDRIDEAAVGLYEIKAHEGEYKKIVDERRKEGKETFLYTATDHFPNSFALSTPAESYWSIMYALASGNDGFLRWAYDAWVKDPLKDTTHFSFQAGDCFLIYPGINNTKPCLSFRMILLDLGVRDANKLNILKKEDKKSEIIEEKLSKVWKDYSYKEAYSMLWGPCIHRTKWADEKGKLEIAQDAKIMQNLVDELAK